MNFTLRSIAQRYPSNHYSLILWSHGTGWLPPNTSPPYTKGYSHPVDVKSFGKRNKTEMSIQDLAAGIPDDIFEVLIFDACFMGCVEVAFELKAKAKYFIASPTEILAQGFPYKSTIPLFYNDKVDAVLLGESFFSYYNQQEGDYRSASIGVINLLEIEELARITRDLLATEDSVFLIDREQIQAFDSYSKNIFFDFEQAMKNICTSQNLKPFTEQLYKTVLYCAHTDYFMNIFRIETFCGMSCYVPQLDNLKLNEYYQTLSWYNEGGFNVFF
jgi:hypothetical protein